ncbi:histone H3.v1 [Anopheles nili]|uniref:histone H3.v1 n=1 Tax=Anopheles nili TaxID=185578 RepID=UPI00237A0B0E|nr:histone H3.v1 [Anopheles nili]
MHSRSKIPKFNMYNNSNGSAEHGESTTNAAEKETTQSESSGEVLKAEKQNEAERQEVLSEEEAVEEEASEHSQGVTADDGTAEPTTTESPQKAVPDTDPKEPEEEQVEEDVIEEVLEEVEDVLEEEEEEEEEEEMVGVIEENASEEVKQEEDGLSEQDTKNIEEIKHEEEGELVVESESRDRKSTVNLDLCRVCMGTEELSDIFQLEGPVRVSDVIMKICTNVRITARDHLPHKICERCLGHVRIVNEFKIRCEASDKELRKNLRRSTNKGRRQTDVIVVNCPMSDTDKEDDEPVDDDEYKVSQSEVESEPVTSDDSFSPPNKRKRTPKRRGRPAGTPGRRGRGVRKPKHMAIDSPKQGTFLPKRGPGRPPKYPKTTSLKNIVYIEAPEDSSSSGGEEEVKRRRRRRGDNPCPKCDEVLPSQLALKQHLKSHPEDRFNCDRCSLFFKTERALTNHIERHEKADKIREEKRKEREQRQRDSPRTMDTDEKKSRFSGSYGSANAEKKKKSEPSPATSGRDLFKCVAPLTSTYWSDSFSD